ncbi:hypothetical protein PV05_08818 [Exophiala xenobiotica]|uniref:Uncharacterized protein n=1 Tax=Exophiala xenobiotica TaxID=348802 RepID=A0A0D2EZR4_9EURO|nr:uncharacterized protein PV05_08818 [Exophiala xenobiotica]KIW53229.1 hypothetical protein PV05_08818 [Exophiala xenobiotica]
MATILDRGCGCVRAVVGLFTATNWRWFKDNGDKSDQRTKKNGRLLLRRRGKKGPPARRTALLETIYEEHESSESDRSYASAVEHQNPTSAACTVPRLSQQSQITPGPSSSTQTPEIAPKDTSVAPEEPNKDKPVQEETNSSTPMNEPDNVEEAAQTAISTWREEISDGVVKPPQDNDGSSSVKNTPADPKGKGKAFDVETVSRSQSQQSAVSDHVKTKNGLEGQLNRHLGQLDRIRRVVGLLNNEIQGLDGQLAAKRRLHREDPVLLGHLQTEIEFLRGCRNTYVPIVGYHHDQIQRIADERADLDKSQGQECTVYHSYLGRIKHVEWLKAFSY